MANPFDDDADDRMFNKKGNTKATTPPDDDFNFYEKQIEQILQSTLDSSNKSVLMLEESEQIGSATANDLLVQGEKLRKVDKQLDEINDTTKQTQRHLNNVKSIFGGVKNYFLKKPSSSNLKQSSDKTDQPPNQLEKTVTKLTVETTTVSKGGNVTHSLSESSRAAIAGSRWGAMDEQIDENLDQMSANLRRLKDLGSALNNEIDDQNRLLDKIAVKADKTDVEIRHQDKQMKRILGGGDKKKPNDDKSDDKGKGGK